MAADERPSADDTPIQAELRRVLTSQTFGKAHTLRALVEYLARPGSESVSEYGIAVDVLGRRADFDPRTDATVRVQISRLRTKLKQFYEGEGQVHTTRLDLPMGEHRLVVREITAGAVENGAGAGAAIIADHPERLPGSATGPAQWAPSLWTRWSGVAATTLVGMLAVVGAWSLVAPVRPGAAAAARPLPRFWSAFFESGKPARLTVPTPVFYQWAGLRLRIRDHAINEYADYGKSEYLQSLVERYGTPSLSQSYSVASDTTAAIRLTQHLTRLGFPVVAGGTRDLPLEAFGDDHIIFLGIPATTSHIHESLKRTNFWMDPAASVVRNRAPRDGERTVYQGTDFGEGRRRDYGVIALLPARTGRSNLLVLASGNTAALSAFLIAAPGLEQLDGLWTRHGRPPYFEILVQTDVDGNTLLKAEPLALRPLSGPPPRP